MLLLHLYVTTSNMLRNLATKLISQRSNLLVPNRCFSSPTSASIFEGIKRVFDREKSYDQKHILFNRTFLPTNYWSNQSMRMFHARNSKVRYLDFRYRFPTNHLRLHLLIIRRQKMKKHQKKKWRKKYKSVIAKTRLKREIAKEKTFRVELLTMIRRAEQFDPQEYALRKIHEANSQARQKTREERLVELKELIRVNRYQTDYIKPKHKKLETFGLVQPIIQEFATN